MSPLSLSQCCDSGVARCDVTATWRAEAGRQSVRADSWAMEQCELGGSESLHITGTISLEEWGEEESEEWGRGQERPSSSSSQWGSWQQQLSGQAAPARLDHTQAHNNNIGQHCTLDRVQAKYHQQGEFLSVFWPDDDICSKTKTCYVVVKEVNVH